MNIKEKVSKINNDQEHAYVKAKQNLNTSMKESINLYVSYFQEFVSNSPHHENFQLFKLYETSLPLSHEVIDDYLKSKGLEDKIGYDVYKCNLALYQKTDKASLNVNFYKRLRLFSKISWLQETGLGSLIILGLLVCYLFFRQGFLNGLLATYGVISFVFTYAFITFMVKCAIDSNAKAGLKSTKTCHTLLNLEKLDQFLNNALDEIIESNINLNTLKRRKNSIIYLSPKKLQSLVGINGDHTQVKKHMTDQGLFVFYVENKRHKQLFGCPIGTYIISPFKEDQFLFQSVLEREALGQYDKTFYLTTHINRFFAYSWIVCLCSFLLVVLGFYNAVTFFVISLPFNIVFYLISLILKTCIVDTLRKKHHITWL